MLKIFILTGLLALALGNPIATPLLGRLVPQPGQAPANTEHAGYVGAVAPVLRSSPLFASSPLIPATYTTVEHLPLSYAGNYLSYTAPIEASAYRIVY